VPQHVSSDDKYLLYAEGSNDPQRQADSELWALARCCAVDPTRHARPARRNTSTCLIRGRGVSAARRSSSSSGSTPNASFRPPTDAARQNDVTVVSALNPVGRHRQP
jgi:hypothetical protein